jgi:hypothetical protein
MVTFGPIAFWLLGMPIGAMALAWFLWIRDRTTQATPGQKAALLFGLATESAALLVFWAYVSTFHTVHQAIISSGPTADGISVIKLMLEILGAIAALLGKNRMIQVLVIVSAIFGIGLLILTIPVGV